LFSISIPLVFYSEAKDRFRKPISDYIEWLVCGFIIFVTEKIVGWKE
jgi:hypothetical protein